MSDIPSRHRLIENELLVRRANKKVKRILEEHTPDEEQAGLAIDFYCECSTTDCDERVNLSLAEYEKLHIRGDRFVIAIGHDSPSVEKIVTKKQDFLIVEKYALPA